MGVVRSLPIRTWCLQELRRDHGTDRVAAAVLGAGATAPVSVEAGDGVKATGLELSPHHIAVGHGTKSGRLAPPAPPGLYPAPGGAPGGASARRRTGDDCMIELVV